LAYVADEKFLFVGIKKDALYAVTGTILSESPKYLLCNRFSPEGVLRTSDKFKVF
jgi:hypothetical protein